MQFRSLYPLLITYHSHSHVAESSPTPLFEPEDIVAKHYTGKPLKSPDEVTSGTALITSLEHSQQTWAFVKECIIEKGSEKVFKATDEAMKKVSAALLSKHGIDVSSEVCKQKKKRLDEQHRRAPHHLWGRHWAYVRGESTEKPASEDENGNESCSLEDDVLAATTFTKGDWFSFLSSNHFPTRLLVFLSLHIL